MMNKRDKMRIIKYLMMDEILGVYLVNICTNTAVSPEFNPTFLT